MPKVEFRTTEETVYVAGRTLAEAVKSLEEGSHHAHETAQEAYNSVGYFELLDDSYEVYAFHTVTQVGLVDPPYTPRS